MAKRVKRAKKRTVAEQRERWRAPAKREREARKAPGEARLAWINRPGIKARMAAATWRAQVEACRAALAKRSAKARG